MNASLPETWSQLAFKAGWEALPICLVALFICGLRLWTPRWRLALLALALVRLALPVVPEFSGNPLPRWSAEPQTALPASPTSAPSPSPRPGEMESVTFAADTTVPASKFNHHKAFGLLWFAGVLVSVAWILSSYRSLSRHARRSLPVTDPRLIGLLDEAADSLGVRQAPRLRTCPGWRLIALHGIRRPSLLVPDDFGAGLADEEIITIFRHELAHLRRRDLLWNAALLLLCAVHWYHPLVWLLARVWRAEVELRCDEIALRHRTPDQRRRFGSLLLNLWQSLAAGPPAPATVAPFLHRKVNLKHRIAMIAHPKHSTPLTRAVALFTIVATTFFNFTVAQADEGGKRTGVREGDAGARRPSPEAAARSGNQRRPSERQAVNVFRAYDKNQDGNVTVDEWLMMRHLAPNDRSERATVERSRFQAAGAGTEGRMNQKQFVYWYTQSRFANPGEGGSQRAAAESTAVRRGPRDGEGGIKARPRDGEGATRRGPRDGEGMKRGGPRDGEGGATRGPRDGGGAAAEGRVITINADSQGRVMGSERRPLDVTQMRFELRRIAETANGRKVVIRASQGMSAESLQMLMRECQQAGIKNLFFSNR